MKESWFAQHTQGDRELSFLFLPVSERPSRLCPDPALGFGSRGRMIRKVKLTTIWGDRLLAVSPGTSARQVCVVIFRKRRYNTG